MPRLCVGWTDAVRPGFTVLSRTELATGDTLDVGRHGDVLVGLDPDDDGISRHAVSVSRTEEAWSLTCTNANGVVIHPWGQPPRWSESDREISTTWPLVGLRLVGARKELVHWVLLEDWDSPAPSEVELVPTRHTAVPRAPAPLTDNQVAAVQSVFEQHLAWPPFPAAGPRTLQSAASRLGVTSAAVYQRLEAARARAQQAGAAHRVGVSDPDYVYVLVRAGLLGLPSAAPDTS